MSGDLRTPELVKRGGVRERVARALKGRERCAREDAEEAERLKAEEEERKAKVEAEVKAAKRAAWVKLHVVLCEEIYRFGRPRRDDLRRWLGRMAGTSQMGAAFLGDLNTMFALDVGTETVRAMLRLGLATQAIALNVNDAEVTLAMDQAEEEVRKEHPQITQITQIGSDEGKE